MLFLADSWAAGRYVLDKWGISFSMPKDVMLFPSRPEERMKIMGWLPNRHNCVLLGEWDRCATLEFLATFDLRLRRSGLIAGDLVRLS